MIKKSPKWTSIQKRIQRMPRALHGTASAGTKHALVEVRGVLDDGIRKNNLAPPKLSSATKQIRRATGQTGRESVLRGTKDGMLKSLQIVKKGNKWVLEPHGMSKPEPVPGMKKQKSISWKRLWAIHENGVLIFVTTQMRMAFAAAFGINLRSSTTHIRIPARHPMRNAVRRYTRSKMKTETNRRIIAEMKKLIS